MADPLVLLPDILCDARLFQPQIAALSRDTAVMVAPLTRGERIEELASDVLVAAPRRFAVYGCGLGALVAMEVLRRGPERITRLALTGASPLAETPLEASDREPLIIRARSGRFEEVIDAVLPPDSLAPGPGRIAVGGAFRAMARDAGPEVFVRQSRALQRRRDQQSTLAKAARPLLVIGGAEDRLWPVKRQRFMAEIVPEGRFEEIAGAGHMPTLEAPEAVTRALRDWLGLPLVLR